MIVVHTGYKSDALEERCLRSGADEVVVKTGDIDALTAALRRAAANRATVEFDGPSALESRRRWTARALVRVP